MLRCDCLPKYNIVIIWKDKLSQCDNAGGAARGVWGWIPKIFRIYFVYKLKTCCSVMSYFAFKILTELMAFLCIKIGTNTRVRIKINVNNYILIREAARGVWGWTPKIFRIYFVYKLKPCCSVMSYFALKILTELMAFLCIKVVINTRVRIKNNVNQGDVIFGLWICIYGMFLSLCVAN